jgi:hypothetical protein
MQQRQANIRRRTLVRRGKAAFYSSKNGDFARKKFKKICLTEVNYPILSWCSFWCPLP